VIRHTRKFQRNLSFQYLQGRFITGAASPNAGLANVGNNGTFEALWAALSLSVEVSYWGAAPPTAAALSTGFVQIAMDNAEYAADLRACVDDMAYQSYGRDAYHVMFSVLEVGT
jgi:hypothetical protein